MRSLRIHFMRALLVKLFLVFGSFALLADSPPNVILIMADDLGWGDVGFNGNQEIRTPHLDRMAEDGIKLERFYAQAPSCSPTRASCLTGRNGYRFGVIRANNGRLETEERSLAEILSEAGFATGHFGKWHVGTLTNDVRDGKRGGTEKGVGHYAPPWENGYDVTFATESKVPTWNPMERPDNEVMTYWEPRENASSGTDWVSYQTHYWIGEGRWAEDNLSGDDSRVIVDRVLPFIDDAVAQEKPFFASIWFHTPHLPVVAGPEYAKLYEAFGDYKKHYYGCITAMDAQIGRLRDRLSQLGVADDTLIFFASDNGPETIDHDDGQKAPGSAGPFRGYKRTLFEGGIRVPGIVLWPNGIKGGKSSSLAVCTSDYLPTILAACDIEDQRAIRPLDGMNVLSLLQKGTERRRHPIPFQFLDQLALIDDRYKLYSNDGGGTFQLFDMKTDTAESTDMSAAHPSRVKRMSARLLEWTASCRASAEGADY